MVLNDLQTDLNIIVGLCIGHDILFTKYSEAPVTTFIVKDRVTGHNPAISFIPAIIRESLINSPGRQDLRKRSFFLPGPQRECPEMNLVWSHMRLINL